MEQIRRQFKKQTGLAIWIRAHVHLLELPLSSREVVEKLSQDIDKYEYLKHDWEKNRKEGWKINHINWFQFYNFQFYEIDFHVEEKIIELEYGIDCYYFVISLNKTLFDLGGRFIYQNDEIKKDWELPKGWKKLKHWKEYKWYNRPKR